MKKISIVAAVAFVAICAFSSCKKTFNCSCTTTSSINDSVTSLSTTKREYRTTKADAKSKCTSWSQVHIVGTDTTRTNSNCMFE